MAKIAVKVERQSPSPPPISTKEETRRAVAAAEIGERESDASSPEVDDSEIVDTETGDVAEQKPLSHQQAMEHFKDALAEIVVVCYHDTAVLRYLSVF